MSFAMTPGQRRFALIAHITASVGLLGAVASFFLLALAGLWAVEDQVVRAAYLAMNLLSRYLIVPLAVTALLSGVIQSLGTPWGLFRHQWVLAKLLLTAFATAVLLEKLPLIAYAARLAAEEFLPQTALYTAGLQLAVHSAGGLFVLLVPVVLSVYKPRGLTSFARRQQPVADEARQGRRPVAVQGQGLVIRLRPGQVIGIGGAILLLHLVVLHLLGFAHLGH